MPACAPERIEAFGISFTNVTFDELCSCIAARIEAKEPAFVVTPNVDHICLNHTIPSFRAAYQDAHFVLADGKPVMWASRLIGKPLRQKLSGSDLVPALCAVAAEKGYTVFFLGAGEGVGAKAAEVLTQRHPSLRVAGAYSPPMGFAKDAKANAETLAKLQEAQPDICFVALSAPFQEEWMARHYAESGAGVMLGIGAGLDFVAGSKKRAPRWMQRCGLEWFWRLAQEPMRLGPRYLKDDLLFLPIFWREIARRAKATARGGAP